MDLNSKNLRELEEVPGHNIYDIRGCISLTSDPVEGFQLQDCVYIAFKENQELVVYIPWHLFNDAAHILWRLKKDMKYAIFQHNGSKLRTISYSIKGEAQWTKGYCSIKEVSSITTILLPTSSNHVRMFVQINVGDVNIRDLSCGWLSYHHFKGLFVHFKNPRIFGNKGAKKTTTKSVEEDLAWKGHNSSKRENNRNLIMYWPKT